MKLSRWLENWGMTSLKINARFLEMEFKPSEPDREAAWDLYVEMLTRIVTQPLAMNEGDEQTALDSVYSLFPTTRAIAKEHGRGAIEFTKIAVVVLNQVVRPFTSTWHRRSLAADFETEHGRREFREELLDLQQVLVTYSAMLADMAGVEDLTALEGDDSR